MIYLTVFLSAFWVSASIYLIINSRKISYLKSILPADNSSEPAIAIIIAVRNEEKDLEEALESLCKLDYRNYKLIVVNDRSTDSTPQIIARFEALHSNITVLHIKTLPTGWLGKNHALYKGYMASDEEWLLFTDADIKYATDTVSKAIQYSVQNNLDHLTAFPEVHSRSAFFNSIMDTFKIMLFAKLKPWKVADPKSKASIGIGAFNLLRRTAYEAIGTHQSIALRPDDDLKLGARIKASGFKQGVVFADGQLKLEWYTSVKEFINGLMKNTFSTMGYSFSRMFFISVLTFIIFVLPLPFLLITGYTVNLSFVVVTLFFQVLLFVYKRGMQGVWWYAVMMPVAGSIIIYIMWKSALLTLRQGGIYWRDSFYSLSELKKQADL